MGLDLEAAGAPERVRLRRFLSRSSSSLGSSKIIVSEVRIESVLTPAAVNLRQEHRCRDRFYFSSQVGFECRIDLLKQQLPIDRLGLEFLAPRGEEVFSFWHRRGCMSGENDHRNSGGCRIGFDAASCFPTIEFGQTEIHKHQVGIIGSGQFNRL